jgi:hypothetical protein
VIVGKGESEMNKLFSGALTLCMLGAMAVGTLANTQTHTPVINHRQAHQQARIRQGIKSGQLTRGEARRLEAREGRIQASKLSDKASGKVTARQRRRLNARLNRSSRAIYRMKHNARVRK